MPASCMRTRQFGEKAPCPQNRGVTAERVSLAAASSEVSPENQRCDGSGSWCTDESWATEEEIECKTGVRRGWRARFAPSRGWLLVADGLDGNACWKKVGALSARISSVFLRLEVSTRNRGIMLEDEDGAGPGRVKVKQFLEIAMLSLECDERGVCFLLLEGSPTEKVGSPLA